MTSTKNNVVVSILARVQFPNGEAVIQGFTSGEVYRKAKAYALKHGIENPSIELKLVYDQPRQPKTTVRRTEYLVKDQSRCFTLA